MHTLSLKVPDDLFNQINEVTMDRKIPKSLLIRKALQHYLKEVQVQKGSFLDLAQDLCGVAEGPHDLSSNPKHMQGYGK